MDLSKISQDRGKLMMNGQLKTMGEEVKGLYGISKANPYSPACFCDGCIYSFICYGGRMRHAGGGGTFCFIDMLQEVKGG